MEKNDRNIYYIFLLGVRAAYLKEPMAAPVLNPALRLESIV